MKIIKYLRGSLETIYYLRVLYCYDFAALYGFSRNNCDTIVEPPKILASFFTEGFFYFFVYLCRALIVSYVCVKKILSQLVVIISDKFCKFGQFARAT